MIRAAKMYTARFVLALIALTLIGCTCHALGMSYEESTVFLGLVLVSALAIITAIGALACLVSIAIEGELPWE